MTQEVVEAVSVTVEEKFTEDAKDEGPKVSYADSSVDLEVVEGEVLNEDPEERTA